MQSDLSEEQLDRFTQELEAEIAALEQQYGPIRIGRGEAPTRLLPAKQRAKLEQATGETATTFWAKLQREAQKDICQKGGFIHDQWHSFTTMARKDLVKVSAGILTGMGISGENFPMAVVPVALWIFTALTHIGLRAFCESD